MKAALIGNGKWGKILAPYIKKYFDLVNITTRDLIIPDETDAVFIATPIDTHYKIAKYCLNKGKHVFLEKPMAVKVSECNKLIKLAGKKNLVLYTDYLEMTAPSRIRMKELLPRIGQIQNITAHTLQQSPLVDINWQLTCHQISMLSLFINLDDVKFTKVKSIDTIGLTMFHGKHCGILFSNIDYPERKKTFSIYGNEGELHYNKDIGIILNGNLIHFNEDHNLDYSIQAFISALRTGYSNIKIAKKITEILQKN